jgi:hypothetical protein
MFLEVPIMDLAFFIHASISISSLRRGVLVDPKYLKLETKCSFFHWVVVFLLALFFLVIYFFASLRVVGKYIHSVLDLEFLPPRCMFSPILAKWLYSWAMASWSS